MNHSPHDLIAGRPGCKGLYISARSTSLARVNVSAQIDTRDAGVKIADFDRSKVSDRRPALYFYEADNDLHFGQMLQDLDRLAQPSTVFLRLPRRIEERDSRRPTAADIPRQWGQYFGSAILLFRPSIYALDPVEDRIDEIQVSFAD